MKYQNWKHHFCLMKYSGTKLGLPAIPEACAAKALQELEGPVAPRWRTAWAHGNAMQEAGSSVLGGV